MKKEFFAPRVSADTKAFWEGCKEHKLLIQKCTDCGKTRWPAAYLCPHCLSEQAELAEMGPEATVHSFVVFRKPFHPSLEETLPYIVATVDLDEDVRIVSNIVGCEPGDVHCGDKVELAWADGETYTRPVFKLKG